MRVLLVHCHPLSDSYGAALRDAAARGLESAGHTVVLRDLYAEGFRPAMTGAERRAHMIVGENVRGLEDHAEVLRRADALVLVHPSWWFGMPAMLKGWFDRLWRVGVAWVPDANGAIRPGLANIRRIAVVTTYGSPRWLLWYVSWPDHKLIARGIRRLCAPRCRLDWIYLSAIENRQPAELRRFLERVERRFARW